METDRLDGLGPVDLCDCRDDHDVGGDSNSNVDHNEKSCREKQDANIRTKENGEIDPTTIW